ncbi:TM0106 family RecB-like putative nuclease [Austwickia chelonae]|uniref:TM0106 family RecB-like putative nuclease n=1 Tax=Austwickia chelonae TaxID=100225 RepID=UPI000E232C9A|nr:TM0106 family RecB-like putative nuclease [Austwickia chelonae]
MHRHDDRIVLSPTDLTTFLACPHATRQDLEVARGHRPPPPRSVDDQLMLISARGMAHEREYLRRLESEGRRIVEIGRHPDLRLAEIRTVEAMRSGADVVYQGTLYDGTWLGYADFLIKDPHASSDFGEWAYDLVDTKLSRHLSTAALLQLSTYARRLETLQGVPPQRLIVVTGDGEERVWRPDDVEAYAARTRDSLESFVAAALNDDPSACTEGHPVAQCARCHWFPDCQRHWEKTDDLSLVAGMRHQYRTALRAAGITTVAGLATATDRQIPGIGRGVHERLRRQAGIQIAEREDGRPRYDLLPHVPGKGLASLPTPDAGDVYLDFEGDPFAGDGVGREYLAGIYDREGGFHTWWAHDDGAEGQLTADLLEFLIRRWQQHPGMHVYHYAPYEESALKRLTGRHGVGESELDALLRGGRLVDLYAVVRQGLLVGKPSYSIKKLEDLYWGHTRHGEGDEVADAMSSVVEYERFLETGEEQILHRIAEYNKEDVRSTLALHDWLEERRNELIERLVASGEAPPERPSSSGWEEVSESESAAAEKALAERLLAAGHELLAGLVGWHRREDRPDWWDFFRRAEMSDEELLEDSAATGRPGPPSPAGERAGKNGRVTSRFWRYSFPPQNCKFQIDSAVYDVDTRTSCGKVIEIDTDRGEIVLSRKASLEPAAPRGLMPSGPIDNTVLRGALTRQAEAFLAGGSPTGMALVHRKVPECLALLPEESPADAVRRIGLSLDGNVLAVQGPPGAGKTYAASRLVRALLSHGYKVGITAQSHAVIRNLLDEIGRPALHKVGTVRPGVQDPSGVVEVADNTTIAHALVDGQAQLVGGTAWLWARDEMAGSVDVLIIDEAGQFSLANAVAVAGAARSVVLLGDPQQLTQPTKADHPHGAGISALAHLIGESDVIPPDRGLFLDVTYRMHPQVTAFVSRISYDGRLRSAPDRERQSVQAPGLIHGSGLRQVPVTHQGNVQDSPEEAQVVARLVNDLLQGKFIDAQGSSHPMSTADILVVAPYNAHVTRLRTQLPEGVRVGTVDAFQGQQAPVVIYSTGSSSALDAPRGISFLYDVHRLNVAVSRAKALAVWVGSPSLLDAAAATPEQIRLVNALCLFAEQAEKIDGGIAGSTVDR